MSVTFGDWNKLYAALDKLKNVEKEVDDDAQQQAEMLKQAIQSYVTGQQGGWTPLAPYTVNKQLNYINRNRYNDKQSYSR